ncbi:hypothetical protein TruAng_012096 [Truncatella angustata]|nr:hypothetical protein TruAng_012096 [Truncatella angustata]
MESDSLTQLRACGTVLIADTADFDKITKFKASEGTTNPSLLYAAATNPSYEPLIRSTIAHVASLPPTITAEDRLRIAVDFLAVQFGKEIYKLTGRISTEVDVSLSFDTLGTVAAALRVIDFYAKEGVPKEDIRIKISATMNSQSRIVAHCEFDSFQCTVTIRVYRCDWWSRDNLSLNHSDVIVPTSQNVMVDVFHPVPNSFS